MSIIVAVGDPLAGGIIQVPAGAGGTVFLDDFATVLVDASLTLTLAPVDFVATLEPAILSLTLTPTGASTTLQDGFTVTLVPDTLTVELN